MSVGISKDQFWQTSNNGKAMLVMLAQRGDVELVRAVCEWLVSKYQKELVGVNLQRGATEEQAKTAAAEGTDSLRKAAESISDANVMGVAPSIVDACFQRYFNVGKAEYEKAMTWFASELRRRVQD